MPRRGGGMVDSQVIVIIKFWNGSRQVLKKKTYYRVRASWMLQRGAALLATPSEKLSPRPSKVRPLSATILHRITACMMLANRIFIPSIPCKTHGLRRSDSRDDLLEPAILVVPVRTDLAVFEASVTGGALPTCAIS